MNGYIIFSDLKGYSKLAEAQIRLLQQELYPELAKVIGPYSEHAVVWNTWGDAIISVFENGKDAVDMALSYKEFFKNYNFNKINLNVLLPRIAGHFGQFDIFADPILGRKNILGTNINTTARIEPVTRAGEIYVTEQFKYAIEQLPEPIGYAKFNLLGNISLAKSYGDREIYRLYNDTIDKPQIIDKVLKIDLSNALPEAPQINDDEGKTIAFYKQSPNTDTFINLIDSTILEDKTGEFIIELAKACKDFGQYEKAVELLHIAEGSFIAVDGIKIYPYKHKIELLKLKANCLTRLGEYEQSADILYGLWQSGLRDSDTLSMLAAQYKRRAIYSIGQISKENINIELLIRARDLYIEAFRINNEDYYPAINAAYLYKIIGGIESGRGTKLATYILSAWGDKEGENWCLDSTLAEAELLHDNFEDSPEKFKRAINKHKPDSFKLKSVYEQITIYAALTSNDANLAEILNLLKQD